MPTASSVNAETTGPQEAPLIPSNVPTARLKLPQMTLAHRQMGAVTREQLREKLFVLCSFDMRDACI